MSLFVQITPDLSNPRFILGFNDEQQRRLVRSQAMKAFREQQRRNGERASHASDSAWRAHRTKARCTTKRSSPWPHRDQKKSSAPVEIDMKRLSQPCISHMICATHVYRTALVSNFVEGYFPVSANDNPGLAGILTFWTSPTSQAMEIGNDALALLHLGGALGDERISLAGHRKYLRALEMVRHDVLQAPGNFEGLFAAAQDLLSCEIYTAVSSGLNGWEKHIGGINAIVETQGFASMSVEFNAFLSAQFRHVSLIYALVKRSPAALPNWNTGMYQQLDDVSDVEILTRLALEMPVLLEATDCLVGSPEEEVRPNYDQTFSRLQDIESRLDSWLKDFREKVVPTEKGIEMVESSCGVQPHLAAVAFAFHRILLLQVYEAQWLLSKISRQDSRVVKAAANKSAEELFDSISHLTDTTGGDVGKALAVRAPIHFAMRWYRRCKNPRVLRRWLDLEEKFREGFGYLDWDALLPFSFIALLWIQ